MFTLILLIYLANLCYAKQEITNQLDLKSFCTNKLDAKLYSSNDYLYAYFRVSINESIDKIVYQKIGSLDLNFDLSPTKILFSKRNEQLIRKDEDFKLYANKIGFKFFKFKKHLNKLTDCSHDSYDCLIQNYDHCWFDQSSNSLFNSTVCLKGSQIIQLTSNKSILKFNEEKINGLALVRLRNFNEKNWIIFKNRFAYLDRNLNRLTSSKFLKNEEVANVYQPFINYFGCAQPFCLKATFDDIIYDTSLNQLIIYRGLYYYQVNL